MSNAHKGARLLLSGSVVPVDYQSMHLDCNNDATGILNGNLIEPLYSSSIYTFRDGEGKFGGSIAVEESTTNIFNVAEGTETLGSDTANTTKINNCTEQVLFGNYSWKYTNTSGNTFNMYVNGSGYFNNVSGTVYTLSCYAKRLDGKPITTVGGAYIYTTSGSATGNPVTITPLNNGWYRLKSTYTPTGSGNVTLTGFTALDGSTSWYFDGWQVESKSFATSYTNPNTTRSLGIIYYPATPNPVNGAISFWVKLDTLTSSAYRIFVDSFGTSAGSSNNNRMYLALSPSNQLSFMTANSSTNSDYLYLSGITDFSIGYALVVACWDSGGKRLYFGKPDGSGVIKATSSNLYFPSGWTDKMDVGSSTTGEVSNSIISDFYMNTNRSLSEEEVWQIYLSNKPLLNQYDKRAYAL